MKKNQSQQTRLFPLKNPRQLGLWLLSASLLLSPAPPARALVKTWDGGGANGNWGTPANWTDNIAPVNGDDLVFQAVAAYLVNTNNYANLKVKSVTFTGSGYTLRGNALTVTNGISGQQAAGANTVECIVTLGAAQTFDCITAGASQFLMGNVTNVGLLLTASGSGSVTLGGSISGTGGVTKNGTGTLTYSGAADNLYTGPTRVTAGLLQLAKSGAVSLAGGGSLEITGATVRELANVQIGTLPVTVNAGGLLDLNGFSDTIGNSLTLNGGGDVQTGAGTLYLAANNTLTVSSSGSVISGNLSVGSGTSTWDINGTFTISADISGSASITKTGTSGVYLYGANTFTGPLAINESWLSIGTSTGLGATNGATTINNTAYLAIHNDIDVVGEVLTNNSTYTGGALYVYGPSTNTWTGTFVLNTDTSVNVFTNCALALIGPILGTGGITKSGPGTLTLSGSTDNTYTGDTTVNEGLLELNKSSGWAIGYGSLTIGDGVGGTHADIVRYTGTSTSELDTLVPITVNSSGLLDLNNHSDGVNGSLTLNDGDVQTGTGTLSLDYGPRTITVSNGPSISGRLSVGSGTCTIQGSGYLYLYADVSGSANIVKNGSVSLMLYGANTFSGTLTANNSGYLWLAGSLALGGTNAGTALNDSTHLYLMADYNITNEPLTLNSSYSPVIYVYSGSTNTWSSTNFTLLADAAIQVATNGALELIGPILGTGGITKYGPGRLRYSGATANTYTGDTIVNEGLLELNKSGTANAIRGGSLIIGDGTGGDHADIVRYTGTSTTEINLAAPITVNSSGFLDLNGDSDDVGAITLNGGDIATGAGTIRVSGNVISLGSSRMATISGHLYFYNGLRTITVADGAAFYDLRITASVADAGAGLVISNSLPSDAWVQLLSSNNFSGPLTLANLTVDAEDNWSLGQTAGATTVASNGVLWVYFADIAGEPLTLNGGAELVSQGLSSWGGQITLNGDPTIRGFSGALFDISGPITGTGNLSMWADGNGTLRLSGSQANTYVGSTLMRNGTLELGKTVFDGAIPSTLQVGDATHWATNRYLVNNQIGNSQTVTLYDGSVMDLNNLIDGIGTLNLYAARVETGTGYLAMLAPGRITALTTTNGTAAINGWLKFDVDTTIDVQPAGAAVQLNVNANVFDSPASALTKAGPGALSLNASNSYRGLTLVQDGYLWSKNAWGLGATNAGTIVSNSASLVLKGAFGVTNEALTLNGGGGGGSWGALDAETLGTNFWTGPITLNATSTIAPYQVSTALKITGAIGGPGGLTQFGYGKLYFEGGAANTYAGVTRLNQGTLVLDRTTWSGAIPADLIVGDGVGGADADVVQVLNNPQINDNATVTVNSSGLIDWSSDGGEAIGALAGSGHVELGAGILGVGVNNPSTTFSGLITGAGGQLQKVGSGVFTLTGDNTYSGRTYVTSGTLLVNGSQPASGVEVASMGTLGGSGTVGDILCYGNLRPGTSAGCLTSSNLTFTSSGTFYVELLGTTPCAGYDQMIVRGTNNLANAMLNLTAAFPQPVSVGDQFVLINNDGTDPITGTFLAYPNGATYASGGYELRLNYNGGSGNDVVFTVAQVPGAVASAAVTAGNGNHSIDPNECNDLSLVISNQSGAVMAGVTATLSTTTPGVLITQPYSTYPDLAINAAAGNQAPFQVSTLPSFACGADIDLQLAVNSSLGAFTLPLVLSSGEPAVAAARYDNNTVTNVPDFGTIESTNTVNAWTNGPLTQITVSLWLVAPIDSDMNLTLIAPNGVTVDLSSGNGAGANFGTGSPDAQRTTFDDSAATPITAGAPPFVGTFRPEGSLASLLSSSAVGNWRLRIQDTFGSGSPDTLRAWSLFLYGTTCPAGGGACELCLPPITGSIDASDPVHTNRVARNFLVASCGAPKTWPGVSPGTNYHYDVYSITNTTGSDACVTVELLGTCDVHATAYLNSFNPADLSQNYLGDAGWSTGGGPYGLNGPTTFSCTVPAGAILVVTVNEITEGQGCPSYALQLSGLPCPPPTLAISPAGTPNNVRVYWPTWAGGYQLEARPTLDSGTWSNVTTEPIVSGGRYNVTNQSVVPPARFYRLRMAE